MWDHFRGVSPAQVWDGKYHPIVAEARNFFTEQAFFMANLIIAGIVLLIMTGVMIHAAIVTYRINKRKQGS